MKRLWKFSISRSIIGGFLLVLIPIVSINLMVNYFSITVVKNEVMNSYKNSVDLLADQLEGSLNKFEAMANVLSIDDDLNHINYSQQVPDELVWEYVKQLKQLQLLSNSNELDSFINVYLQNKNRVLSSKGGISNIDEDFNARFLLDDSNPDMKWRFQSKRYYLTMEEYLSLIYDNNILGRKTNIVVCIDINVRSLYTFLKNLKVYSGGTVYLLDEQGNSIFTSDSSQIDISALRSMNTPQGTSQQVIYTQSNNKYWVFTNRSGHTGLTLGVYFPEEQIMRPIYTILYWIAAIVAISVALAVLFTLHSHNNFLSPIHRLINAMHRVREGDLKVRIPQNKKEELGFMFTQFNRMVEQIDLLVNEVYAEKLKNQMVNLRFLQSQINPHFLYNSLYSVYHMINVEDLEGASNMTMYLGEYFRFAIRSNMEFVSLGEELDNIHTYINIHKIRYPRKINHHIEVDGEIRNIIIPRLTIQPLVENAIVHGLEGVNRQGNIWIKGMANEHEVVITVEDDGKGICDEKLDELRSRMSEANQAGDMYGIYNTNMRLKLKFGAEAGIFLEKREPVGVKAVVTLPGIKE